MRIRVLLVEDEPEFMRRFSDAILADPELELLGVVASGQAAISLIAEQAPDALLIDLGLPDISGVEVIRQTVARHPQCDALVVTMFGDDQHVMAAIKAGATGYLLKDASTQAIAAAIHEVRAGGSPISPSIARRILTQVRAAPKAPAAQADTAPPAELTARELEILRLTAKGLNFDAIAELLELSHHTVVTHVKKNYRKLAVHSRGEAVFEAQQIGLL